MIQFEKIRWCNFLSTGNQFTEVDLNAAKSTLIIGKNGSGKSTLSEAIIFALYGKPYRNINKPQLVNSITNKDMLVELEFSIGSKKYLIRRGMKPNIFEIFKDGKLVEQNAAARDYQDHLEKTILKMSFKTFTQIAILGSSNYVPFMKLSPGDRRLIIEDLLDIQIFSVMNVLIKSKAQQNKDKIKDVEHDIELVNNKIELSQKHLESLRQNNQELIERKESLIEGLRGDITSAQTNISDITTQADALVANSGDKSVFESKKKKVLELESELEKRKTRLARELKFFCENDTCPTCKQDIDHEFKMSAINKRELKQQQISDALGDLETKVLKLDSKLDELEAVMTQFRELTSQISGYNLDIRTWSRSIEVLQKELDDIRSNTSQLELSEADTSAYTQDLKKFRQERKHLLSEREIMEISSILLKDGGIKTRIIKQYIPIINKLVNKYLSALDFFVNFELDEKFSETIKSRFRDEFSYASFSEGEKLRIDLSILFAWRAVAKMRNNSSTNLLILDEVFDSSLDANGVDEFLKILNTLTPDTNTFIISHRGMDLHDKFDRLIEFEKVSNFSRIKT